MSVRPAASGRRSLRHTLGASLALTFLVGGVVVGTAAADTVGGQQQKVAQIADRLDAIQNKIDQLDDDYNAAQDRKEQLDQDIADAQVRVDAQQAQLDQLQGTLGQIAVDKYTSGQSTALSPVFSDAATYSDAQQRDQLNRLSIDNGAGDVDEAAAIAGRLAKDKALLESKQAQAADVVTTLDTKKDQATKLEAQYEDDYAKAKAELGDLVQQEQERRAAAAVAKAQEIAARQAAADKAKADADAAAAARAAAKEAAASAARATPAAAVTQAAPAATTPRGGGGDNGAAGAGGASDNTTSDKTPSGNKTADAKTSDSKTSDSKTSDSGKTSDNKSSAKAPDDTSSGKNGSDSKSSGGGSSSNSPPPPSSRAGVAIAAAQGQLGVPYRFAAESPGAAFDCSGLTKYAWGQAGVSLPHQSAQQFAVTPHVSRDQIQPGDLLYYHSPIGHVAIYIGGNMLIHAPRTGDVVKVAAVNWANVVGISRPG